MASDKYSQSRFFEQSDVVYSEAMGSLTTELDSIWFTTEQAARYLGLSTQALLNMTSNGRVPFYKLGRRNRYKKAELVRLLESNKKGPNYD